MASTAIPKASAQNRKEPKPLKHDTITVTSYEGESTSSSSNLPSSSNSSDNDSTLLSVVTNDINETNDFVGSLLRKPGSPAIGNDYLTIHHVFGDYIRKHEIPRKVFHSSIGFLIVYLYTKGHHTNWYPPSFTVAFLVIFAIDLIRFRSRRFNYLYCQVVGFLMREKEVQGFNGVLWYILGLDFSFYFFSKDIALLSVLLLSWADTAASTCGRKWGYLTPKIARNKSLAGSMAAFTVGVITSYLVYGYLIPHYWYLNKPEDIYWTPESSYLNLHTMSFLAGFVTALSEGIDLLNWDDNFTIPVLSSIFMYCVITVFHK